MACRIIDSGLGTAEQHMQRDAAMLKELATEDSLILHQYEWDGDSATYGYFLDPYKLLDRNAVQRCKLQLARRPTGGGLIFHLTDLAFSVLVPAEHPAYSCNTLDNYAFINRIVINAVQRFLGKEQSMQLLPEEPVPLDEACKHFCMAKPTKYDVMLDGRKVGGAAQRRTKAGFLHQGTIALGRLSDSFLEEVLLPGNDVVAAMRQNTHPLLGESWSSKQLLEARSALRACLEKECC